MLKTITRAPLAALALAAAVPAALAVNPVLAPLGLSPIAAALCPGERTAAFLQSLGNRLTAIVNGSGSTAEKKAEVLPILNQDVDVEAIGRFCLGRFWRVATPAQQQQYLALFHQVLVNSITGKLGDYRGVSISVGQATSENGDGLVPTVIDRPGQAPVNVQWKISNASGAPKVVDIVAEGVSLSINERDDYASYLAHHRQQRAGADQRADPAGFARVLTGTVRSAGARSRRSACGSRRARSGRRRSCRCRPTWCARRSWSRGRPPPPAPRRHRART